MKICLGCFYLHVGSWIVELKLCLAPFSNCSFYTLIFVDEANSETILSRSSAMRAIIPPLDMMSGCVSLFLPSISIPTTEDHDRVVVCVWALRGYGRRPGSSPTCGGDGLQHSQKAFTTAPVTPGVSRRPV